MPRDGDSGASDLEARNHYLSIIDDAWEVYREAVEGAWAAYEEALKPVRDVYEEAQAAAEEAHGNAIDAAWADYKQAVATRPRRCVVTSSPRHGPLTTSWLRRSARPTTRAWPSPGTATSGLSTTRGRPTEQPWTQSSTLIVKPSVRLGAATCKRLTPACSPRTEFAQATNDPRH